MNFEPCQNLKNEHKSFSKQYERKSKLTKLRFAVRDNKSDNTGIINILECQQNGQLLCGSSTLEPSIQNQHIYPLTSTPTPIPINMQKSLYNTPVQYKITCKSTKFPELKSGGV